MEGGVAQSRVTETDNQKPALPSDTQSPAHSGEPSGSNAVSPALVARKKTPDDFRFGKLVGEGSFSSVYLAKDVSSGEEFAMCSKNHIIREKKGESIRREKEALAILSANRIPKAPFFVRLYATFQDQERLYFVLTFGRGGELLKYLQKAGSFDIPCSRFYTAQLVLALAHLHNLSIVHRDLKPENILLDERGHILITDFGSTKFIVKSEQEPEAEDKKENVETTPPMGRGTRSNSFVGTAQYVSPEVLKGKYTIVGPSADLWALGCVLYQFVSGLPPFHGPNEYLIFQKILKLDYHFPPGFDPVAVDLVQKLLKLDYLDRLGVNDVDRYTSIQAHAFFQETQWDTLHSQEAPLTSNNLTSSSTRPPLQIRREVFDSLEPGFNPRIIAERSLRDEYGDEDFPNLSWGAGAKGESGPAVDSDDDEEEVCLSSLLTDQMNLEQENRNRLLADSTNQAPAPRRLSRNRHVLPTDDGERQERLEEQAKSNPWHSIVNGNLILKQGLVSKRKGLFSRRRMLLLTEGPKLYYCEPNSMAVKGEIPWSSALIPEPKDFRIFYIHTPNRTYNLDDPAGFALEWCKVINEVRQSVYGDSVTQKK